MSRRVPERLRALVRDRAQARCEYCPIHEEDAFLSHRPDHIVAVRHRGLTHEANLAWSCYRCNLLKGSDIASIDLETGRVVRLFHPRRDRWGRHFRVANGRIVPLTPVGRVTECLLQFNRPRAIWTRLALIRLGRYPG